MSTTSSPKGRTSPMRPEDRRFTGYQHTDVLVHTLMGLARGVQIVPGTSYSRWTAEVTYQGTLYLAVFLGRSSDWYRLSLPFLSGIEKVQLAMVGTHDSCLKIPVYALDQNRWYESLTTRYQMWPPFPEGKGFSDRFRKTHYGHSILLGGLLCKIPEAEARLASLPTLTQKRIHREVDQLTKRRSGKPIQLFD